MTTEPKTISTDLEEVISKHDGELQRIRRRREELQNRPPSEDEGKALMDHDHFEHLMSTSSYTPISRQKDERELARLKQLALEALNAQESREKEKAKLYSMQLALENSLLDNLKRANRLMGTVKARLDEEVGSLDYKISRNRYVIERDTSFLLSEIGQIERDIEALREKLTPNKKLSSKTLDSIKIEVEINRLQTEKQSKLNRYSEHERWVESIEAEIRKLEYQKKIKLDDYREALGQVKAAVLRISGITLED